MEYQLSLPCDAAKLPFCVDYFLNHMVDLRKKELCNVKGADASRPLLLSTGAVNPRGANELFWISGEFTALPDEDAEDQEEIIECYTGLAHTPFLKFGNRSEIFHSINYFVTPEAISHIPFKNFGTDPLLRPHAFRCAFELYDVRLLSASFGLAPIVTECILIEANRERLLLRIESENIKAKTDLPLQQHAMFEPVAKGLKQIFNFDLVADYQDSQKKI